MTKQQIIEFAQTFGYAVTDRKNAAWAISHIRTYHGDKTVGLRDVWQAWR